MIVIVDYDTGNLRSVQNALHRVGCEYEVSSDPQAIRSAERVLLPGVGEASTAMEKLCERGLEPIIKSLTQPVLGICIGMQLMCLGSEEGNAECMGIFDTQVRRLRVEGLKIPHMGWNTIEALCSPLFDGMDDGAYVYYVHSFGADICPQTIAATEYGVRYSAALNNANFYGTQFHPEKSGGVGEQIMKNFLKL